MGARLKIRLLLPEFWFLCAHLQSLDLSVPSTVDAHIVPVPHNCRILPPEATEGVCAGGKGWKTKEREGPFGALLDLVGLLRLL